MVYDWANNNEMFAKELFWEGCGLNCESFAVVKFVSHVLWIVCDLQVNETCSVYL